MALKWTETCWLINLYREIVYDDKLNMYVTDNKAGLCLRNKIITVCSEDRRPTNMFCGKTAEFVNDKSYDCASNGYSTLFPANDAVTCSIFSSLYMP
jgi:hypothetical protein